MSVGILANLKGEILARCSPWSPMLKAVYLMVDLGVNALAVIAENDELAGIITDHDVMRGLVANKGQLDGETVSSWMTRNVITCASTTKLDAALRTMGQHKIRHLVVVEGQRPVAVIGIRELLAKVHADDELALGVLRDMSVAVR